MDLPAPPSDPIAQYQYALSLHSSGRLAEAAAIYRELLERFPGNPLLLTGLGTIAMQHGELVEGVRLLELSVGIEPEQSMAYSNLGLALRNLKRLDEALANLDRAIALAPDLADAYNHRGIVLQDLKRLEEALLSFDRAIALRPDFAEAYNNRGVALQDLYRLEEALQSFDRAIALRPDNADAYNNRGRVLRELGRLTESLASCNQAIALKPDYASAYLNKSILKLVTGDFAEGWRLYEWRWKDAQKDSLRTFSQPLWLGEQPLSGKTVLIHPEQGLGDFIQFCRYVPMVEALGAKVVLEVPAPLVSLVSTMKGQFTIVPSGQSLPSFDLHCPIMSLPLAFKATVDSIPASVPYLYADAAKQEGWQQRLGRKTRPRVGLVWSGNAVHKNDFNRSIPFRQLGPLLSLPFEFHALQKDIRPTDAAALVEFGQVHLHQAELSDFSDTGALMQEMDWVISVDTSVAHLAGALGKPVWVLLPFNSDYRWMLERSDSPWYPSATLSRQPVLGDWGSVIGEVAARLQSMAKVKG